MPVWKHQSGQDDGRELHTHAVIVVPIPAIRHYIVTYSTSLRMSNQLFRTPRVVGFIIPVHCIHESTDSRAYLPPRAVARLNDISYIGAFAF